MADDKLTESHAIAQLTDSYKFDLEKKEHKEILKSLVRIAEKRIDAAVCTIHLSPLLWTTTGW